jgi:hypothetical protein
MTLPNVVVVGRRGADGDAAAAAAADAVAAAAAAASPRTPSPYLADDWEDSLRRELALLLDQAGLLGGGGGGGRGGNCEQSTTASSSSSSTSYASYSSSAASRGSPRGASPAVPRSLDALSCWYVSEKKRINALAQWADTETMKTINKNLHSQPPEGLLEFAITVRQRTDAFKRSLESKTLEVAARILSYPPPHDYIN